CLPGLVNVRSYVVELTKEALSRLFTTISFKSPKQACNSFKPAINRFLRRGAFLPGNTPAKNSLARNNFARGGTNVRVLGKYVRDENVFRLEDAVRKMTSLPDQTLRLKDRGLLKEGYWADVVVFDPTTVSDTATYENPSRGGRRQLGPSVDGCGIRLLPV